MGIDALEITSDGKTLLSACTAQITALGQNGKPLGKAWPYQLLPTAYSGSPETPWGGVTVSADGHIYVAAHECPDIPGGVPAHFYSIQADGTSVPGWPISSRAMYWAPAIGSGGTIFQMDEYNSVNAYSPDGTFLWSIGLPGYSQGPIALDGADNLYIGTDGPTYGRSSVFSINPSGVMRNNWPQNTGGVGAQTAAAVDANGHIFITNYAGVLYGFNTDGSTIAGFPLSSGGTVSQQPLALSATGIIYLKTSVGLFAVNSAGARLWKAPFNPGGDASLSPSPIVDSDGAIYVAFGDKVYSLDPNGSVRPGWPVTVPKAGAMALAQAGVLYVVSAGQQLYSIGNASTAPGTISVSTNLSSAKFTITGPKALSGSGTNETFANVPPGTYTITYTAVAGYGTPPAQTKTLTSGQEIAFAGTYKPHISGVSTILPEQTQTITITGTGFGTHTAYTGDSAFIKVSDVSRGWNAGYSGDPGSDKITLIVNSWTDTSIVLGGFAGNYGPGPNSLKPGDQVSVQVWNTKTGQGPAEYKLIAATPAASGQITLEGLPMSDVPVLRLSSLTSAHPLSREEVAITDKQGRYFFSKVLDDDYIMPVSSGVLGQAGDSNQGLHGYIFAPEFCQVKTTTLGRLCSSSSKTVSEVFDASVKPIPLNPPITFQMPLPLGCWKVVTEAGGYSLSDDTVDADPSHTNLSTGFYAVDIAGPSGTPVLSAGDGTVVFAQGTTLAAGWGNTVIVRHSGGLYTRYAHLLLPLSVQVGDAVMQGQQLGLMGSTGLSFGPHLHFQFYYCASNTLSGCGGLTDGTYSQSSDSVIRKVRIESGASSLALIDFVSGLKYQSANTGAACTTTNTK